MPKIVKLPRHLAGPIALAATAIIAGAPARANQGQDLMKAAIPRAGPHLAQTGSEPKTFSFGVGPRWTPTRLAERWIPVLRYVSDACGVKLHMASAPSIGVFADRVNEGWYDFIFANPAQYLGGQSRGLYSAFARAPKPLSGIVFVSIFKSHEGIASLANATMAFPSPHAFGATLVVRAELDRLSVPIRPRFVRSHDSAVQNVLKGATQAGTTVESIFDGLDPNIRGKLRVIYRTKGYTPHAFAVRPEKVPAKTARCVKRELTGAEADSPVGSRLQAINLFPVIKATDSDWDDVRALDLGNSTAFTSQQVRQ